MVYMLLGTGFEETEAIAPLDLLRRAEIETMTVGVNGKTIYGAHGIGVEAMAALKFAWDNDKFVAAICAGPTVLADLGITDGLKATCYPGCEAGMGTALVQENVACVCDGRLITGTSAGCAVPFGLALVEALKGADVAHTVAEQFVIR